LRHSAGKNGGRVLIRTYPAVPLVGVGAIVFRQGRVLLVRRAKDPRRGEWSLPGGLQKLGETVAEAARREVFEETALRVRILDLVDVVDLIERDEGDGRVRYHYTLVDLVACWQGGEIRPGSDAAEAIWADVDALAHYGLWAETTRVIALAFERWRPAGSP
jgi:ADP-ribose pyrophosphatase YjhB (NUDIX family)